MPEDNAVPQFQTAEFHDTPSPESCCVCHQPISGSYYRIKGAMACPACAREVLSRKPADSHVAFTRALLFGAGAALLGLILYSAVGIIFHVEIGFISLAVGYMVGKAMMRGSGNLGGRRYQWAAVLLTYAAVSVSAVPIGIAMYLQSRPQPVQQQSSAAPARSGQGAVQAQPNADATAAAQDPAGSSSQPDSRSAQPKQFSLLNALAYLLFVGLASPVMNLMENPASGAIGIIILLVGVRIAWRIAAGTQLPTVEGPY